MKRIYPVLLLLFILVLTACTKPEESTKESSEREESSHETVYPTDNLCEKAEREAEDHWIPVWCEEFDYTGAPDPSKWYVEHKGDGFGNNELQYYTRRKENVYVEDGALRITIRKENYLGRNYTSAKLMSRGDGYFLYGKIDVRAKLPKGRGTWPAIWMMPKDSVYGGWPHSGEIDIMEHVGYNPNRIYGTIHTGNYNHMNGTQKGGNTLLSDVFDTYHVYSIEWDPHKITWFVDGKQYFEFKNDEIMNPDVNPANWPFDQEFYIILNAAMGGDWGGAQGIDPTFTESSMYVDYVRVYKRDYEALDQTPPEEVNGFELLKTDPTDTLIKWDRANDDVGISHYEVYLNGEFISETRANRITFNDLEPETEYELKVIAVDFSNKKSTESIYQFTSGNYPSIIDKIKASSFIESRGIFLQDTQDIDGGKNVFAFDPGDYLLFQLSVPETTDYRVFLRVAAYEGEHEIELIDATTGEEKQITQIKFEATGGYQNWETVIHDQILSLTEGKLILKVKANSKDFNLNWIQFEKIG